MSSLQSTVALLYVIIFILSVCSFTFAAPEEIAGVTNISKDISCYDYIMSALLLLADMEAIDGGQKSKRVKRAKGSYQFSQAVSYLTEVMDDQGNLYVQFVKQTPNIIAADVKSRDINYKVYHTYIDYVLHGIGHQSIQCYCCGCPNGNLTVGCCSHVAAIIYYLSFVRYLSRIIRPAEILSSIFATDKMPVVINQDSDDD